MASEAGGPWRRLRSDSHRFTVRRAIAPGVRRAPTVAVSFLAPIWLVLTAAVAVPLFLHLLRRRIEIRREFPAARYLLRAEKENVRRLKLRNMLLMLLRTLALLFLALAAARPIAALLGSG